MKNNNKKTATKAKTTDIKVSSPKKVTNKALQVSKPKHNTKSSSNLEVVEIRKFADNQRVSFKNKKDVALDQYEGVYPTICYDTSVNFKNSITGIDVVTPADTRNLRKASKSAIKEAKRLANEAVAKYDHDMKRIELVSIKNLEVARIEALRILTKAVIIEKNHHEQVYEKRCHEETIKNITLLKNAMIEMNNRELTELLSRLKHDYEVELKENEYDFYRAQNKIEEKLLILQFKRRAIKKQIKELNDGKNVGIWATYVGRRTPKNIIADIKKDHDLPIKILFDPENQDLNDLNNLMKFIKNIDTKKLSAPELKIWNKFVDMVNFIDSENKYYDKVARVEEAFSIMEQEIKELRNNTIDLAKSKKLVLLSPNSKIKSVLAAKKNTLSISKPACLYAAPTKVMTASATKEVNAKKANDNFGKLVVKTKVVKVNKPAKIDPIAATQLSKAEHLSPEFKHINNENNFQPNSMKFSKLEAAEMANHNKMKFETIEYTNYKWEWKGDSVRQPRTARTNPVYGSTFERQVANPELRSVNLDKMLRGVPAAANISKLQQILRTLPEEPIVIKNDDVFKKEKLDVKKIISQFRAIDTNNYHESAETNKLIEEIKHVFKIYHDLCRTDLQRRKNILKAQRFDETLASLILTQDDYISKLQGRASLQRQQQINAIVERYNLDVENTKNQHLLNQEAILQKEQDNLAKEEETYLWNSCLYYKPSNDYANSEYRYENAVINGVVRSIEKFNRNSSSPISLANIPNKIAPMPITSNARVDINFEKNGGNVYAVARHSDQKNELVAKISTDLPSTIEKIYVLDKFRAVKGTKTRVALLTEFANQQYQSAVLANKAREKREFAQVNVAFEKRLNHIDHIYKDAAIIDKAAKCLDVAIRDADWVQREYEKAEKQRWNEYAKAQAEIKNSKERQSRQEQLQYLKEQKENERIASKQAKYNELATTASNKSKTTGAGQVPASNVNKFTLKLNLKKNSIKTQNFIKYGLFNKQKPNEISIDEIIGKRK